jgi:hypothetical protein
MFRAFESKSRNSSILIYIYIYIYVPRVEADYNVPIVALQVVQGDDNGIRRLGYNWVTLSLGDINIQTSFSRLGVGQKADDLAPQKYYCCKIQKSENRMVSFETNLAETSKEGNG